MGSALNQSKKEYTLHCPHCSSKNIVQNGHPHQGKLQFICKTCGKYFSEDAIKGYPPSNIPFPVIAYLLYFRRKIPEFSNMRKYRSFVNHWLRYLRVSDQEFSRQTIHHWINNYDKYLDKVITFHEARAFCKSRISEISKYIPPQKPVSYTNVLKVLQSKFGKKFVLSLIRGDPEFYQELVEVVSKHGVFSWEFFKGGDLDVSHGYRSLSTG